MRSSNSPTLSSLAQLLCVSALAIAFLGLPALAQEANVLGLPAVPQPKPGSTPAGPAGSASAPKSSSATPASRDVIAGEMSLQHSALNGVGRLVMTTKATFATAGAKSNAIDAARSVQRDLVQSCAKQCKPIKMSPPKVLASGQLEFELAFAPLYQHLNQAQFVAALQSRPFNLTPAQLTAPAASPISVSVEVSTASAAPVAAESPAK